MSSKEDYTGTKGIPQFKGTSADYAHWATNFSAHWKVKGFKNVMNGMETVPDTGALFKDDGELKSEFLFWLLYSYGPREVAFCKC